VTGSLSQDYPRRRGGSISTGGSISPVHVDPRPLLWHIIGPNFRVAQTSLFVGSAPDDRASRLDIEKAKARAAGKAGGLDLEADENAQDRAFLFLDHFSG
jgi:hypothetical protein